MRILTPSACMAFMKCPQFFHLLYNSLVRCSGYNIAPTVGSAFHVGTEAFKLGKGFDAGIEAAAWTIEAALEAALPDLLADQRKRTKDQAQKDRHRVCAMLRAYWVQYHDSAEHPAAFDGGDQMYVFESVELKFDPSPLINPDTGRASRTFKKAGRTDGIVKPIGSDDPRGVLVYEQKTISDTVDAAEAIYRVSIQCPTYQELAEMAGHTVVGSVLDLVKKPVLKPRNNKKDGKEPLNEWEDRCFEAYRLEPDKFFRRIEIPYDGAQIYHAQKMFWRVAQAIRDSDRLGYLAPRGPHCNTAHGPCDMRRLCWYDHMEGYTMIDNAHPELSDGFVGQRQPTEGKDGSDDRDQGQRQKQEAEREQDPFTAAGF